MLLKFVQDSIEFKQQLLNNNILNKVIIINVFDKTFFFFANSLKNDFLDKYAIILVKLHKRKFFVATD